MNKLPKINRNVCKDKLLDFLNNIDKIKKEEKNPSFDRKRYSYLQSFYENGHTLYFYYSGEKLAKIIDYIIYNCNFDNYFSEKELTDTIFKKLIEFKFRRNCDNDTTIIKIINELNTEPQSYTCLIPLYGVPVDSLSKLSENISFYPYKDITNFLDNKFIKITNPKDNFSTNFATVKLTSVSANAAIARSISFISAIINTLRIFESSHDLQIEAGIKYEYTQKIGSEPFFILNQTGKETATYPYTHKPLFSPISNLDAEGTEKKKILLVISSIIDKKIKFANVTQGEEQLYLSTNLIGKALSTNDKYQQILNFMSAIEALVEQKDFSQGITDQVSERVAFSLSTNEQHRLSIYKEMKKLYSKRSKVIHGEVSAITSNDLNYLEGYSKNLWLFFLNNINKFNTTNDVKNFFIQKKFEIFK